VALEVQEERVTPGVQVLPARVAPEVRARVAPLTRGVQEKWLAPGVQEVLPRVAAVAREALRARAVRVARAVMAEPVVQIMGVRPDADAGLQAILPAEGPTRRSLESSVSPSPQDVGVAAAVHSCVEAA
jgi:hypothetical protein